MGGEEDGERVSRGDEGKRKNAGGRRARVRMRDGGCFFFTGSMWPWRCVASWAGAGLAWRCGRRGKHMNGVNVSRTTFLRTVLARVSWAGTADANRNLWAARI